MDCPDVVIFGAGHAGAQAAIALRQRRYAGRIVMIGAEPDLPYERPPLSKDYLAGGQDFHRLLIRPPDFWPAKQIELLLGNGVGAVSPHDHQITLASGERLSYGTLIWATGGWPRRLSCAGADLEGVHSVKSRADVDLLKLELESASKVVVIGAGYIGLETAAILRKLGKQVVLLEAMDRVLARVTGDAISRFYEARHRAHGVDLRTGASVARITGSDGRVTGVQLDGGEHMEADLVIVGIGIIPAIEPLAAAGVIVSNGVHVDEYCRTSDPDIYAIGDCALHANKYAGGALIRLECVQNASDQAQCVAQTLVGSPVPYGTVPWFWSNQYDLKLQTLGISAGHDDFVLRGDPATRSFSVIYLRQGKVIALDCVNSVRDFALGKAVVQSDLRFEPAQLADTSLSLKDILNCGPS